MPPTSTRSAAAARRLRAQAITEVRMRDDVAAAVAAFSPQGPLLQQWDELRPTVARVLSDSRVTGTESVRKHLTHVGYFLMWAREHDLAAGRETVTRAMIDEYARTGMPDSSDKSRADRRSRLRSLADRLNPEPGSARPQQVARPHIKAPYSHAEMATILRIAGTQPAPRQRRALSLCVALGAGAGLDSVDLRHLRGTDIDDADSGVVVTVSGPRPRRVVVHRDYEQLLRDALNETDRAGLVFGRVEARRNIAAAAIADAVVLGDCPPIEQSRLRTTWLVHLLSQAVPLGVVLHAAGLTSGRTLTDLLPYLPPPADADASLRCAGMRS